MRISWKTGTLLESLGKSDMLLSSGVEFGKAAFAGFTEAVVQVDTGFLHGTADHVIADVSGAGEEVA